VRTIEALMQWGASDPTRFSEATSECEGYLSTYASNRDVPEVRMLQARGHWLAGKPAEAGAIYRAIYGELKGDTASDGYDRLLCLRAGIQGARALLEAKDTLGAREIYTALESQTGPLVAGLPAEDPLKPAYQAVLDEAMLGSGYVDLAAGQSKQALSFFQGRVNSLSASSPSSLRYGACFGLGLAFAAEGKLREASIELAKVAALEPSDRDRIARATVELARVLSRLPDGDARQQACERIKDALARYGDTPAAVQGRQLQKELGC